MDVVGARRDYDGYAELKCKTNFSFLRGASHPEEFIHRAAELGLAAIALNDNDGVYGIPKAHHCAQNYPSLKLIVGSDVTVENHPRLTFLAQNRKAYGLLCRLITAAHEGRPKGEPLLGWTRFLGFMSEPASQGLIVLPDDGAPRGPETRYDLLKEIFGGRLYIPLSRLRDGHDKTKTERALALSRAWEAPVVAVNDVHYHVKERRRLQDVLTAIRHTSSVQKAGYKLFPNGERHLKSPAEMRALFRDMPEVVDNTLVIAEQCVFSCDELRYRYPSEWIPAGRTAQSYLEELTWAGARERYPSGVPSKVEEQIKKELKLIGQLQFADYFLTIQEIIQFARDKKILCQGRGSAANSAVCYVLGITAIDPSRTNLLFERFISAERGEPPDIDVDFEHERREEVIQHVYEKYGRHRAAMVSAVVTYRTKSAFREIAKSLGADVGTLSAKKIEKNFEKIFAQGPSCASDPGQVRNPRQLLTELSEEMAGFPRHLSIHSGGFTLSADPITEIVPVEPARMEGRTIIQWDKYDLDYLGLLKVDLLALGMLSALRKTLDMVGMRLHEIPAEDPATYAMIQKADTVGTFQIESRAQISMLGRLLPKTFYDLVIQVAIVRPGPIVGKMVHPYLKRRRGEPVHYPDPRLKDILHRTLGVPLFQEQVMQIAISLAGFTPGEADELRRAIGAWRSDGNITKMGQKLMDGLRKNGLPKAYAEQVYQQVQGFATYGFPESHSASFALLAYASSYLKCKYPAHFTCSLINSQPMGFYAVHTLVSDARRHGVEVLPVDPNHSDWDCRLDQGAIRLGFRVVSGLAKKDAEHLIAQRGAKPFGDLGDFLSRTRLRRDVLHRLAMANAFRAFGFGERHVLWEMLEYDLLLDKSDGPQLNLFSGTPLRALLESPEPSFRNLDDFEKIKEEYRAFRLSTTGHPIAALRQRYENLPPSTSKDSRQQRTGAIFSAAGLVLVRQRPPTAKGVTFATLEDEFGFIDLILHAKVFEECKETFLNHCFLIVKGVIQKDANTVSLLVKDLRPLSPDLTIEPDQYF